MIASTPINPFSLYAAAVPKNIVQTKHPTATSSYQKYVNFKKYLVNTFIITTTVVTLIKILPIYNSNFFKKSFI